MAAINSPITKRHGWFTGENRRLVFHVKDDTGVPVNVASFSLSWMLKNRRFDDDADAVITKATGGSGITVTGSFNIDPDVNAQRVYVAIAAADTSDIRARVYEHELKRTDSGLKGILAEGQAVLRRAVHDD